MLLEDLPRASILLAELNSWREAARRADPAVFKDATLRVVDGAHGQEGVDGRPQISESVIHLSSKQLLPFIQSQISRIWDELRAMGVET